MKTTASHVEDFMREYPYLSKFLRQGVVNYKALARKIEPEISERIGEKCSVGSIAVALQRLHHRDKDKIYSMIGRLKGVRVISEIAVFELSKTGNPYAAMNELLEAADFEQPFATVISADSEVLYLVESMLAQKMRAVLSQQGRPFTEMPERLTGLVVTREILNDTETGGVSYPLQVLAEHGIAVLAANTSLYEEVILVNEAEADRAASVLRRAMWR